MLICVTGEGFAQSAKPSPRPATTPIPKSASSATTVNPSPVLGLNRFSFYTGVSLTQTVSAANFAAEYGKKDQSAISQMFGKAKLSYAILKGRTEGDDLTAGVKKLQTTGDLKQFVSDLNGIQSKYKASLADEQKWYFELGNTTARVREGIGTKNYYMFIGTDEEFLGYAKSAPKGTPPALLASLKQMSQSLKSVEFSVNSSDSDYTAVAMQLRSIYEVIGEFKIAEKS